MCYCGHEICVMWLDHAEDVQEDFGRKTIDGSSLIEMCTDSRGDLLDQALHLFELGRPS